MLGRLSTQLMFNLLGGNILNTQERLVTASNQVSAQRAFLHAYENPTDAARTSAVNTRIAENDQLQRNRAIATQDLGAAESALRGMESQMQRLREIVVSSSNGAFGAEERVAFANEVESIKDIIVQQINTRLNGRYIFSGEMTDKPTYILEEGAAANSGVYKQNQDDEAQRIVDGIATSFNLKDAIISTAGPASFTNGKINPTVTTGGDLELSVNDGNGNINEFTVTLASGDDLSDVISKINTAFIGDGGAGTLAQESPEGYLTLTTSLITGNSSNNTARVHVLSTSDSDLVNELHIKKQLNKGTNAGILHTIDTLKTALNANDPDTLLGLLDDMDFNLAQVNNLTAEVGLSVARMENRDDIAGDKAIALAENKSTFYDVDMVKAGLEINNARAALEISTQVTSAFFQQTLAQFLG